MLDQTPPTDEPTAAGRAPAAPAEGAAPAPADPAPDPAADAAPPPKTTRARRPARKTAAAPPPDEVTLDGGEVGAESPAPAAPAAPAKKATRTRRTTTKAATPAPEAAPDAAANGASADAPEAALEAAVNGAPADAPAAPAKRATRTRKKAAAPARPAAQEADDAPVSAPSPAQDAAGPATDPATDPGGETGAAAGDGTPEGDESRDGDATAEPQVDSEEALDAEPDVDSEEAPDAEPDDELAATIEDVDSDEDDAEDVEDTAGPRRRRRRGGRRRRRGGGGGSGADAATATDAEGDTGGGDDDDDAASAAEGEGEDSEGSEAAAGEGGSTRRRRRRRRAGEGGDGDGGEDSAGTVTKVRAPRRAEDEIAGFSGSTRLEAKKQRRREGRDAGRRRAPLVSEAEFLARRESVERTMVVRQRDDLTQIAVLEDGVLVEHYVARKTQTSLIGNVYLGRVQNVLPSMEAAFIDIGKGRNAVLYAGEVNWEALGAKDGQRRVEQVLKPGQPVLVQVTKDPVGHKGARLTSQISLPGRFLVYVPDGTTSGISRKLPDTERNRLKTLLKGIVPDTAGVIVRTASEGASEEELTRDVERLKARWEDISAKVEKAGGKSGGGPQLLYGEPDLTLKVVRDLFTEDFKQLIVSGDDAWDLVHGYVEQVAPDLLDRLQRHDDTGRDAFADLRIDEQIAKALDRKVFLPSGGSLVIDRTEAMTVVDVNTGKFTGSGGNLEQTVTKNNLEAAEEIVRQLRLRDIGGIIVVDFIDMVLESNRDLVLRRLVECLGRDRTRHQVAEVTSLGLVQLTRKRIGTGLLEAFSEPCEACGGRGLLVHQEPVEPRRRPGDEEPRRPKRSRGGGKGNDNQQEAAAPSPRRPTPAEFAAMAAAAGEVAGEDGPGTQDDGALPEESTGVGDDRTAGRSADESVPDTDAAEVPAEPPPLPVPAGPRIVTSVRRVGARRAAGPPTSAAAAPAAAGGVETEGEPTPEGEPADVHVPVKKKGARKR